MAISEPKQNPEFLEYVYELNDGHSLKEAFAISLNEIELLNRNQLKRIGLKTYEEGKWSIHTILQYLIDWERIWCFRAVLFARSEGTIPEAHNQELMGANSNADSLSLDDLIDELKAVRKSSILLFKSFDDKMLETRCEFFEYEMPLSAIGLTIAAHQKHHLNVILEKYLP